MGLMVLSDQFGMTPAMRAKKPVAIPQLQHQLSSTVGFGVTPRHDSVELRFAGDPPPARRFGLLGYLLAIVLGGGALGGSHLYQQNAFDKKLEGTRTELSASYDGKLGEQRGDFDLRLTKQEKDFARLDANWRTVLDEQARSNESQVRDLGQKLDAQGEKLDHQEGVMTGQKVKLDTQSAELAALRHKMMVSDVQIQKTMGMVQKNVMMMRLKYDDGSLDPGHASGFVVKDRAGKLHFVSCTHGIDDPHYQYDGKGKYTPVPRAEVTMSDGTKFMAKLRHASPVAVMDVSVWDIEGGDEKLTAKLGDHAFGFRDLTKVGKEAMNGRGVEMGETVISGGYPFGYKARVSPGLVTALDVVKTNAKTPTEHLEVQVSSVFAPGNSGGPSTDKEGHVIGVNLSIDTRSPMFNFMLPDLPLRMYLDSQGVAALTKEEKAAADVKGVEVVQGKLVKAYADRRKLFDDAVKRFDKAGPKKIEDFLVTNDTNTNMHFALFDKTFRQQLEGEGIDPAGKLSDEHKTKVNTIIFQHLAKSGLMGALGLPPGSYTIGPDGIVPPPAPPKKVEPKKKEAPPPMMPPATDLLPLPRELGPPRDLRMLPIPPELLPGHP